ncbi:hypothetical protein [Microbulbifer halophilus]|uniref:Uncharacterized protein n=1 Tax=Microbulbifer halophilus TaxID=453963 RepID=A0ABW5EAP7_9GAMM|nr:hypothetical protein [Microbulbifer halophilus]MCW8125764.1 hypothetical protein [Microbulbifer halophilus]
MGSLIFGSIKIDAQPVDVKIQTSKAGVPRPIIFGTVRPVKGNIIATTEPKIVEWTERKSGGLFGPDIKIQHREIYRTYAIRICEGPVTRVERIWRNNELIYVHDPEVYINDVYVVAHGLPQELAEIYTATLETNDLTFLQRASLYLGDFDQQPSPVMQEAFSAENVHAYRGTCYMVMENENLTSTSGAIPQWQFEVTRCPETPMPSAPKARP